MILNSGKLQKETCGIIEFVYDNDVFLYHDNGMSPYDIMKNISIQFILSLQKILGKSNRILQER